MLSKLLFSEERELASALHYCPARVGWIAALPRKRYDKAGQFWSVMKHGTKAILCLCHDSTMLLIRRMLLEHFGYVVLPTSSAEDAKNLVEQQCPDMLLMDNGDSAVDWQKLAEQVKEICPEVITVVLAPYYSTSNSGAITSVDKFVAKDEGPDELMAQINELLGGPEEQGMHVS